MFGGLATPLSCPCLRLCLKIFAHPVLSHSRKQPRRLHLHVAHFFRPKPQLTKSWRGWRGGGIRFGVETRRRISWKCSVHANIGRMQIDQLRAGALHAPQKCHTLCRNPNPIDTTATVLRGVSRGVSLPLMTKTRRVMRYGWWSLPARSPHCRTCAPAKRSRQSSVWNRESLHVYDDAELDLFSYDRSRASDGRNHSGEHSQCPFRSSSPGGGRAWVRCWAWSKGPEQRMAGIT